MRKQIGTLRHGLLTFIATLCVNAATFGFHVVVSRLVPVSQYGEIYTMMSVISLAAVFGSLGTSTVARLAADVKAKGLGEALSTLSAKVFIWSAILGVGIGLFLMTLAHPGAWYFSTSEAVIYITAWSVSTQITLAIVRGLLQGTQHFGWLAISLVVEAFVRCGVGIALAVHGQGAFGAVAGYLVGAVISIVITAAAAYRFCGALLGVRVGYAFAANRVLLGASSAMLALAFLSYSDVLLVKHFVAPQLAGMYSAVALIGKIVLFGSSFVPMLVLPKATAAIAKGRNPSTIIAWGALITIGLSAAILALFAVFPSLPTVMMGKKFSGLTPYVLGYGAAMAFLGTATTLVSYRIGINRYGFVPISYAAVALQVIGITLFHDGIWQIVGVVAAANLLNLLGASFGASAKPERQIAEDVLDLSASLDRATEPL